MPWQRYEQGPVGQIWDGIADGLLNFGAAVVSAIRWMWNLTPDSWSPMAKMSVFPASYGLLWVATGYFYRWRQPKLSTFGTAAYATLQDLDRAGMLHPGGRFMGQMQGRDFFLHGEGHCLTIAAQGGGKTTSLIIPTLITYRTGSVVVTDPKGAITAQTIRFRKSLGPVVVLNPWNQELKNDPSFGVDLGDDGFNPLQGVGVDEAGMDAAALVASILCPDSPKDANPYWGREGRNLLQWGMLYLAATQTDRGRINLANLRSLLGDLTQLEKAFVVAADPKRTSRGWPTLREGANTYLKMLEAKADAQFQGFYSKARDCLAIFAQERTLAAHICRDGLKLSDLKGDKPITVYLICPPGHLNTDDRLWLNLVLTMICDAVGKPGRSRETVLLIDEFPALRFLPNLMGSLEQFRESGLRAHLIAQNPGQITEIYGLDGFDRLMGCCENKQFSRITDYKQAKLISDWCGQYTIMTTTINAKGERSTGEAGVPLIRPEQLTGMPAGQQVVLRTGMNPIIGRLVPYFSRREWGGLVDRNPYREK